MKSLKEIIEDPKVSQSVLTDGLGLHRGEAQLVTGDARAIQGLLRNPGLVDEGSEGGQVQAEQEEIQDADDSHGWCPPV